MTVAADIAGELAAADAVEAAWCMWLNSLTHWERRYALEHELEWHDLFCSGEWGWADLTEALREHFA